MSVHPSGDCACRLQPRSDEARDDQRLLGLLKQAWLASGCVYGYRELTLDMRDLGETCGKHRVACLLCQQGLRSQTRYQQREGGRGGKPAVVAPNHLDRQFTPERPNWSWVTDITSIRTHQGWLDLAVVLDLFSRQALGWSMGSRIDTELVHSDRGCQFTGHDWQSFLRDHNPVSSMSRRGSCHDNAGAASLFQLPMRERIGRQIYATRQDARADVFNYIEMFYNPKCRHTTSGNVSAVEFEKRHSQRLGSVE